MYIYIYIVKEWQDFSFIWSPEEFGGIEYIQIPSDLIWKPDLVLYNSK